MLVYKYGVAGRQVQVFVSFSHFPVVCFALRDWEVENNIWALACVCFFVVLFFLLCLHTCCRPAVVLHCLLFSGFQYTLFVFLFEIPSLYCHASEHMKLFFTVTAWSLAGWLTVWKQTPPPGFACHCCVSSCSKLMCLHVDMSTYQLSASQSDLFCRCMSLKKKNFTTQVLISGGKFWVLLGTLLILVACSW